MPTINSKSLGIVKDESSSKSSNLFFTACPGTDSEDAIVIDLMGVGRTITIRGEFIGNETQLKGYIADIEGLQNGVQEPMTYEGKIISKQVLIDSFDWSYAEADPNRIAYTLKLLEGGL